MQWIKFLEEQNFAAQQTKHITQIKYSFFFERISELDLSIRFQRQSKKKQSLPLSLTL